MKRISEVISPEKISTWKNTDIVTITAGTGAGKSYFIKTKLFLHAKEQGKKILMLIHRTDCVDQFRKEIVRGGKSDIIDIKTYQSLESQKHKLEFEEYGYIVCDEFHYFLSDAAFNKQTDISLNMILAQTEITRIFMSATSDSMKRYLNNMKNLETIDYELPIKFSFIKELTFFNKDETLEKFIQEAIDKNHKGIFFIQSAQKAYELYAKYKDHCLFNCSKSNKDYYKYVEFEKINNMLISEQFDEQILITTTAMDSGVNINDLKVKHIVIDVEDIGVLIQCLGRRRIQNDNDQIYLYIKSINNQSLGGKETQLRKKIEMAEFLKKHTLKEYIQEYPRKIDYSHIIYDEVTDEDDKCTKKINELMYFKCKVDLADIATMKQYGDFGYCKYLVNLFEYKKRYRLIEEDYKKDELEYYLDSIVGKKLYKEDQKELIDKVDLRVDGRVQKSYSKLNEGLKMIKLPFIIIPKKSMNQRYWIIEKFDY